MRATSPRSRYQPKHHPAEFKAVTRASDNRLAALLVRSIRDASIAKRLIYTVLSKLVSPSFAQETYEVAQERAGKELAKKEDGLS